MTARIDQGWWRNSKLALVCFGIFLVLLVAQSLTGWREHVARVRRAGAAGEIVMRFDSGFWSGDTIAIIGRLDVRYTMAVGTNTKGIAAAIAKIDEKAWTDIDSHPMVPPRSANASTKADASSCDGTRLTTKQAALWPDWRHRGFLTNHDTATIDAFHRHHAVVELAIRDLTEGAGLEHVPSGHFFANAAWLACAVLAHNLIRWTATIGGITPAGELTVARTIRTRLIALPGRLVNRSGTPVLPVPTQWPWATTFNTALTRLRAIPQLA